MLPEADRSAILQDLDYDYEALQNYYVYLPFRLIVGSIFGYLC